jgi:hypothetical protein
MSLGLSSGGTIDLDRFTLFVDRLSQSQEIALGNDLARRTKKAFGKGGFFSRASDSLDWLKEEKRSAEFSIAVKTIAEMEGNGSSPSVEAVDEFRQSAEGVAVELYWRTRRAHKEITLKELQAVITETNALEIHLQILEILTDDHKSG